MKKKNIVTGIIILALLGLSFSFKQHKEDIFSVEKLKNVSVDSSYAEVYPTFFENNCFIKGFSDPEKEIRIEIFDINGLLIQTFVLEDALSDTERSLDLSTLSQKTMIVRIYEDQKLLKKARLMKK